MGVITPKNNNPITTGFMIRLSNSASLIQSLLASLNRVGRIKVINRNPPLTPKAQSLNGLPRKKGTMATSTKKAVNTHPNDRSEGVFSTKPLVKSSWTFTTETSRTASQYRRGIATVRERSIARLWSHPVTK